MKKYIFNKQSVINATCQTAFDWHERPGALERLSPPWQHVRVLSHTGGIQKGAKVKMVNSFMGLPVHLTARHIDYQYGHFFQDTLVKSPFRSWVHTHSFFPEKDGRCILEDKIEYSLPWYLPSLLRPVVAKELDRIFQYRHTIFQNDINRINPKAAPMRILISGASGPLGSALIPFFTTAGHTVLTLVRRKPNPNKNEIYWNPATHELDLRQAGRIDVVINLNGAPVAGGKWTDARKKKIIDSRVLSTQCLSEKISGINPKPALFLSASATGYYGDTGTRVVSEKDPVGHLFIADVCNRWEASARPAQAAGIRTVFGRIGVVLTPLGGALQRLLPGFFFGMGARLSHGRQYMSWISMEDIIGAIDHIIITPQLTGAVNLVSPSPVTNTVFTKTLGDVLSRPTPFVIPKSLITMLWGTMGQELLLAGTRALPEKLTDAGYRFCHETLTSALKDCLGK